MAQFPALPMFTDALLADCGYMSDEKFGAYHRLLYLIWRSPNCRIPNNDEWMAERLNRPVEVIRSLYRQFITSDQDDVAEVLCRTDGNWVYQKRLLKELEYLKKSSKRQSVRAKARWNKEKDISHGNADAGNATRCNAPTPTPHSKKETTPNGVEKKGERLSIKDPPVEWIQFCHTQRPDLDPGATFDRFRDYWIGKPGKDGLKSDWFATWRNWVRGEKTATAKGNSHGQPNKDERARAAIARSLEKHGVGITGGQPGEQAPGD